MTYIQGPVLLCGHPGLGPGHVHGDVPAEGSPAGSWEGQQGGGGACLPPAPVLSQVASSQFYSQEEGSGDSSVNLSTLSLFSGNEGLNADNLISIIQFVFSPGSLTCCPLIKMLRGRQDERRTAAQVSDSIDIFGSMGV